MKKTKTKGIEARRSRDGFLFIVPWIIGIIIFFIVPLVKSIIYVFTDVNINAMGDFELVNNNFQNLKYIFTVDGNYTKNLRDSIISFTYSFPIIVIISLIFAVILTQKFKGRIFARAVFFLPVIIATGVVMELMNGSGTGQPEMMSVTGSGNSYTSGMIDASAI